MFKKQDQKFLILYNFPDHIRVSISSNMIFISEVFL